MGLDSLTVLFKNYHESYNLSTVVYGSRGCGLFELVIWHVQ